MANKETDKKEKTSLDEKGIYLLMKPINDEVARDFSEFILETNFDGYDIPEITLIINSPGGSVTAAFAMIDMIKGSSIPVNTIGIGSIASAALMLFIMGKNRTLTEFTSILSHAYSWSSWGKYHDLVADRKEQDLNAERIIQHYKSCTGLKEKIIREKLLPHQDVWLSANDAKELNLCDRVVKRFEI